MGSRVLVTRPRTRAPGARAARLVAAGFEPFVLPLTEIVPLSSPPCRSATSPRWWFPAPTRSASASAGLVSHLSERPVFAVGDETANAARAAGFSDVRSKRRRRGRPCARRRGNAPAKARVAYLCGRVRLDALEAALAAGGLDVDAASKPTIPPSGCRLRKRSTRSTPAGRSLPRWSIRRRVLPVSQGWCRRGRERSFATPRSSASRRVSPANSPTVASGSVAAAETPDEETMFELLARPGHHPAPFPINVA